MRKRFAELSKQILHALWEENPVEATYLGVHAYDSVLPRADADSRNAYSSQRAALLHSLEEYQRRRDELEPGQRLDLELLVSELEVALRADEEFRLPERRADRYPSEALFGVYLLVVRRFAPLHERLLDIRDRLLDTPRFLAEGTENLRRGANIPRVWTEIAMEVTEAGAGLLGGTIPKLAEGSPALEPEILAARDKALAALERYGEFLKDELWQRSEGDFSVGRQAFDFLLARQHHLPYDCERLREFGEEAIRTTLTELEETARSIDAGESWQEIVSRLKDDHPEPELLLDEYRRQMELARRFVEEQEIVSVPADQELHVVETPPFERATTPYAAYLPPAPFEERQDGFFWVTPVGPEAPSELRRERLRGHCSWGIPITALHEGYPGHHLQFCRANRIESHVRRQLATTVFIEGWALYCEEMMERLGFLADLRSSLLRLKDQLWRACRIVVDVGLHCFGMGFEQAVELLVEEARLERANAVAEVRRYTQTPTQPMSYLVGKREIERLHDEVREAEGADFDLKDFHDRLLGYGSIPVALIRTDMLERHAGPEEQ